ncbi:ABC1 atypical kinase-like domain-containing protein [Plasmodiophora brassicae]
MRITGIQARTASAARSSIEWARLRPKLVALMVASAAVVVAAGVIVAVCMSGNSAAQDGPDVNCAGASVGKPETSRVKWTPATAAGAAAGVAGLWAYNRYLKRKPEPERAVVDKPSKQAATSHWRNLKSHMTKVNAVTAAKKGVSILGFDPVDMLFMGMAGLYALEEFQPAPNVETDRNDMDKTTLQMAGVPYIPDSGIMPADTTGEKLGGLRWTYGRNAVFYVIQSMTLNPMGIADRMHMIDAVLRHVRSDDLVSTDEDGRTTLWSVIDLALDDVLTFDQRLPVIRALLTHDVVTPDMVNHGDKRGATMLHSIVNEIRFPSTRPGRVGFLVNIANMLLDKGADGTIAENVKYGFTPRSIVIDAVSRCAVGCPAGRETLVALLTRMGGSEQDVPGTTPFNNDDRRSAAMRIRNHAADIIECFTFENEHGDRDLTSCLSALDDIPGPTSEQAFVDAADGHPGLRALLEDLITMKQSGLFGASEYETIQNMSINEMALRSKSQEAVLWARSDPKINPFVQLRTAFRQLLAVPQEHVRVSTWNALYGIFLESSRRMLHMFDILAGRNSKGPRTKVRMMASLLRTDIRDDVYTAVSNVAMGGGPVLMKTFQEVASSFVDPAMAAKAFTFFSGIRPMPRADLDFQLRADFNADEDRIVPHFDRDHAIGAASIAEGHRTEYDGKPAFAKVKRRFVDDMFEEENRHFQRNYWGAMKKARNPDPTAGRLRLMKTQGYRSRAGMAGYLQPTCLRVPSDLSFANEATAIRVAAAVFAPLSPRVKVPTVLLNTSNVLVMTLAPGDGTLATWTPSPSEGGRDVCDLVGSFEMFARGWFENMLFSEARTMVHSDLHPGNFMYKYVPGDRQYRESGLTVLDWGQHIVMENGVNRAVTSKILAIVIGCLAGNLDMVIAAVQSLHHPDDGPVDVQPIRQAFAIGFGRFEILTTLISHMFVVPGSNPEAFDNPQAFLHSQGRAAARLINIGMGGIASLWQTFDVLEKRLAQAAPSCPCTMPTFFEFVWKHASAWVGKFTLQQAATLHTFWNGGNVQATPDVALKSTTFADVVTGRLVSSRDARRGLLAAGRALISRDPKKLAAVPGSVIRDATAWAHRSLLDRFPVRMHPFLVKWSRVFGAEIAYQSFKHVVLGKKPSQSALTKRSLSKMLLRNAATVVAVDAIDQGLASQRKKLVTYLAAPREADDAEATATTTTPTTKGDGKRPWLSEKAKRVSSRTKRQFDVFYVPAKSIVVQQRLVNAIRVGAGL